RQAISPYVWERPERHFYISRFQCRLDETHRPWNYRRKIVRPFTTSGFKSLSSVVGSMASPSLANARVPDGGFYSLNKTTLRPERPVARRGSFTAACGIWNTANSGSYGNHCGNVSGFWQS